MKKHFLLVVAHPDDETLFFSGPLLQKKVEWTVICVTDGNSKGNGQKRQNDFANACEQLGVKHAEVWGLPDQFDRRLDLTQISKKLQAIKTPFDEIYTHGLIGEYGHPHHQDVSFAVHSHFKDHSKVFEVAYNISADFCFNLSRKEFNLKSEILWNIYEDEFQIFYSTLPCTSCEGFVHVDYDEAKEVYGAVSEGKKIDVSKLKKYRSLEKAFRKGHPFVNQEFFKNYFK